MTDKDSLAKYDAAYPYLNAAQEMFIAENERWLKKSALTRPTWEQSVLPGWEAEVTSAKDEFLWGKP